MRPDLVPFTSLDGATSTLRVFSGTGRTTLLVPALGTPASYYDGFAAALAERTGTVIVAENRGTDSSSVRASRGVDYGYADVLRLDWTPWVAEARRIGGDGLSLIGHSIGGQLGALYEAEHPGSFERIALVTACSVEWKGWSGMRAYTFLAQTSVVGALSTALGFFPGERIGFGGRQGATMMRDWSRQARTGVYAPTGAPVDYEARLRDVHSKILSVAVKGDDYAPRAACDRLLAKMPNASIERIDLEPSWSVRRPVDRHFRWAKEPQAMVDVLTPFLG
jgi:predicted alpha/beta hydrolase